MGLPRLVIERREARVFVPLGVERATLVTVLEALDACSGEHR